MEAAGRNKQEFFKKSGNGSIYTPVSKKDYWNVNIDSKRAECVTL